ncbi:MAG TPA: hypothetical protein PKH24_02480 [Sedimentisphaerales bacterium]|jgi:hypothetical protein|nr:hypothetical protein [Sedimentisphaerales bacterium]HNU28301.1 hypothetical protein [Sedimentisphaerales bacterium]
MTARHIHVITTVLAVMLIPCVGVLLVSFWGAHRMFAPYPLRVCEKTVAWAEPFAVRP